MPAFRWLTHRPVAFIAFGFGSGLSPIAPGTAGTVAAVPLYLALSLLPLDLYLIVVALAAVVGVFICDFAAKALGVHDHPGIVFDEFVGFWVSMALAPRHWAWCLAGFVIFRIFDAAKPWPISWLDRRVDGGFGIMLDDVVAGLATLACLLALEAGLAAL